MLMHTSTMMSRSSTRNSYVAKRPLMTITYCRRLWAQQRACCARMQPAELDLLMPKGHNHGRDQPFDMHRGWSRGWHALPRWQRGNGGVNHNIRVTELSPSSTCSSGVRTCWELDVDLRRDYVSDLTDRYDVDSITSTWSYSNLNKWIQRLSQRQKTERSNWKSNDMSHTFECTRLSNLKLNNNVYHGWR